MSAFTSSTSLAVLVVMGIIFLILLYHIHSSRDDASKAMTMMSRVTDERRIDVGSTFEHTILVLIVIPTMRKSVVSQMNRPPCIGLIESLYRYSKEPSRVNLAIYDPGDVVGAHLDPVLQPSTRIVKNAYSIHRHSSASDARALLMQTCFRGEKYVMTICHDAEVTLPNWDDEMLQAFLLAQGADRIDFSNEGNEETEPQGGEYEEASNDTSLPSGRADFSIKEKERKDSKMTSPYPILTTSFHPSGEPAYVVVDSLGRGGRFNTKLRTLRYRPTRPVLVTIWSPDLSFAASHAYVRDAFVSGSVIGSKDMDITMNTTKFFTRGYDFYAIPFVIGRALMSDATDGFHSRRGKNAKSSTAATGNYRSMLEYQHFLGINMDKKSVSFRARKGLTPSPTTEEARSKVGSLEKARLTASK